MVTNRRPSRDILGARFEVHDYLGNGGFADVWRGTDIETGTDVAIKTPRQDGANDISIVRTRFERAYDVLSTFDGAVQPTSLVQFVDGSPADPAHLITHHIRGRDLGATVADAAVSPGLDLLERYGLPITRAVAFLQENGWLYLDIKPENVLVDRDTDRPVLIDFNAAERLGDVETLFHEDAYKAPEQMPENGDTSAVGPWSDVYSLGKLLAYILTGRSWSYDETPQSGVRVGQSAIDVPDEVSTLLTQATKADQAERPETAVELVDRLYRALGRHDTVATLTDEETGVACPVRVGDTVGRLAPGEPSPTVAVPDSERYISPVQFEFDWEDGWLVRDRSLNGTFIQTDDGYQHILSADGYRRLQQEANSRVPDEQPYTAARLRRTETLVPIDPSYSVRLRFDAR